MTTNVWVEQVRNKKYLREMYSTFYVKIVFYIF